MVSRSTLTLRHVPSNSSRTRRKRTQEHSLTRVECCEPEVARDVSRARSRRSTRCAAAESRFLFGSYAGAWFGIAVLRKARMAALHKLSPFSCLDRVAGSCCLAINEWPIPGCANWAVDVCDWVLDRREAAGRLATPTRSFAASVPLPESRRSFISILWRLSGA